MLGVEEAGIFRNVFFCVQAWSGGFFAFCIHIHGVAGLGGSQYIRV